MGEGGGAERGSLGLLLELLLLVLAVGAVALGERLVLA
jgi:hypothetical protein